MFYIHTAELSIKIFGGNLSPKKFPDRFSDILEEILNWLVTEIKNLLASWSREM